MERESCPQCHQHDQVATFILRGEGQPFAHECVRCAYTWGHACWHCHDDPPAGHTCPGCGLEAT